MSKRYFYISIGDCIITKKRVLTHTYPFKVISGIIDNKFHLACADYNVMYEDIRRFGSVYYYHNNIESLEELRGFHGPILNKEDTNALISVVMRSETLDELLEG